MSLNNYDATGAVQAREYYERVFGPGSVGYDEATKGILLNVGGKQYNLGNEGLTLGEDGRYYAPNEDILKSLAISKVGLVPVRNALQADGLSVGWADDKLIVDGNYYNTDNMVNMGGTLYGEPDYLRQLFGNSARFKNPYGQQQSEWLKKLMGRRFSYDPESDSALQEAQKQAQRSAMRDLARRGIINSTDAAHYTGLVTSQFIPQYEKMAFDRYKEENQIITNVLDTLTKMNSGSMSIK